MQHPTLQVAQVVTDSAYMKNYANKILMLLQPSYYCLDLIVKLLISGPDGAGKRLLVKHVADKVNMKFCECNSSDIFDENIVGTEKKIRSTLTKLTSESPCIIYLNSLELFTYLEDPDIDIIAHCIKDCLDEHLSQEGSQPVVFIAGTRNADQIKSTPLYDIFHHQVTIKPANLQEAESIIDAIGNSCDIKESIKDVIPNKEKDSFYVGKLIDLVAQHIIKTDDERALDDKNRIAETRWEDVGGLSHVKQEIIDTIQMYLDYPKLRKSGLRRSGILLHGPPGTGKTLIAKAVATECNLTFINVRGPELLNKYVGQSEDNIRHVFSQARESSPSIIFFDEFDSIAPNRGQVGDSGSVMDRMVSQLLAEMDGIAANEGVFVIGATNRVDLVDPTLLRPGRFDKTIEVTLPRDKQTRLEIIQAVTRKMKLANDVDLERLEVLMRKDLSGADISGICSKALQRTLNRCITQVESNQKSEEELIVETTMQDFIDCLG